MNLTDITLLLSALVAARPRCVSVVAKTQERMEELVFLRNVLSPPPFLSTLHIVHSQRPALSVLTCTEVRFFPEGKAGSTYEDGKPTRFMRSAMRGSARTLSNLGSTASQLNPSDRS